MATLVRSHSKINLGLAIGSPRADRFHNLLTVYQTLALHDQVTVTAQPASKTAIRLECNHPGVPVDARNTAWKMVESVLAHARTAADVTVRINKQLPVQGGLGAGSANAAAALLGLEQELALILPPGDRLDLASQVGSDVPLFLLGGAVLGVDRGQQVHPLPDLTVAGAAEIPCVVALPGVGVSTPQAFRDWDSRFEAPASSPHPVDLQKDARRDTIEQLSRTYSSVFHLADPSSKSGASGIFPVSCSTETPMLRQGSPELDSPANLHGRSREQLHTGSLPLTGNRMQSGIKDDLAENSLLALVRTGIENDFELVVFPQYPLLREIKRQLLGIKDEENSAIYAALSGSGSALFGLYRNGADAQAAQQRVQQLGVHAVVTSTMPRSLYWANMFAE